MAVSIESYRAAIGFFGSCRFVQANFRVVFYNNVFSHIVVLLALFFLLDRMVLVYLFIYSSNP